MNEGQSETQTDIVNEAYRVTQGENMNEDNN